MDTLTQGFYDNFWPNNVPHYIKTKEYMLSTISERNINKALDAGCGHGICSIVLSEFSKNVTAVDISSACIDTAQKISAIHHRQNISFFQQDLQTLDLHDNSFDLVWCWGVAMMAPDPLKVMRNLFRVTKPGGTIYLGLYLKTWLSPVHQGIRYFCRTLMNTPSRKKFTLNFFAGLTKIYERWKGESLINKRPDNISIQAQVDDWYYPPFKTFYSIEEILQLLQDNGFEANCLQKQVGRIRSATIFVVKGVKRS